MTSNQVKEGKIAAEPLEDRVVEDSLVTSGKIAFEDTKVSHVYSPVTGRVKSIAAALGQHVMKGDALATIDSPDIGLASADLGKAQADWIAAQHDYERQKQLTLASVRRGRDVREGPRTKRGRLSAGQGRARRARQKAWMFQVGGANVTQGYTLRAGIEGDVLSRNLAPGVEAVGQYSGGTERFVAVALKMPFVVLATVTAIIISAAYKQLDIEAYPNPVPPLVETITQPSGSSGEEVERYVTIPLDVGLAGIPGLDHVRSQSLFGLSDIKCYFRWGTEYEKARPGGHQGIGGEADPTVAEDS